MSLLLQELQDSIEKLRAVHTEQVRCLMGHIEAWQSIDLNLKKTEQPTSTANTILDDGYKIKKKVTKVNKKPNKGGK